MNDRHYPITAARAIMIGGAALVLLSSSPAYADVVGRLHIAVKDADTEKPAVGAAVTLHDTANVRPDVTLKTDAGGDAVSPPLENHAWEVSTSADSFETDHRTITVAADTTTDVEVLLEPKTEKVIKIKDTRDRVHSHQTSSGSQRNQDFLNKYPATAGNPQSLPTLLITNPGFVESSVNVVHPRGEHASTSIYLDGLALPGALQGRAGALLSPEAIQSADILTGGYAPEYGSETAAILNLTLRAGTIAPLRTFSLQGGEFGTFDGGLTFGGQGGQTLTPGVEGPAPKRFRYLIDLNTRSTDNALEPPQPDDQTAHNFGRSTTLFGKFDYIANDRNTFGLTLNAAPAETQIANRTGLSGKYAAVGQGFGYGGARNADGTIVQDPGSPDALGSGTIALPSQQAAGQDIVQTDTNNFGMVNLRHTFSDTVTGLFGIGGSHSGLNLHNNSPSIGLNSFNPDGTLTQTDNSIEFNPNLNRVYDQTEFQGSVTASQKSHTFKAGFELQEQRGNESYQFVPQSQLALDALAAGDTRLAPAGTIQTDGEGNPITDVLGNPVYLATPGAKTPTLKVHRSGYYRAAYVQDTWSVNKRFTLNYGLRLDSYHQKQEPSEGEDNSITKTELSPRINASYLLARGTVGRLSFNHLFTQPPLAQGAIVGTAIKPETLDQYDASVEHQIGSNQTVKMAYYYKNIRNQDDTGILIPYTQIGAYTTLNYQYASVHGFELSYDLAPKNNIGFGGYLAYANSMAKAGGVDQSGGPAPEINDHDQRNTISAGVSYTLPSQASVGMDVYYGSGEESSTLGSIYETNSNVLDGGKRHDHTRVNLRLASSPTMIDGKVGVKLDVENIFDSRNVLNFNSGFSGTRFEQGRRVLLTVGGKF
ncbi:MAG: TonB-dependent receptor [Capsulimonas sp.]|uniref:TonB-dependent receptor n=1 Tax=Capsulimonas sp. TaxID=2494211 RepID=UPI003265F551